MSSPEAEAPDPELLITYGDCEFYGECNLCHTSFGSIRPDQSFDKTFAMAWERHAMTGACKA